jgi:phage tail-like protein
LQIETEVFEYAEGGLNGLTHKLPVRSKYGNITLKRGMDPGRGLYMWFLESMRAQAQGKGLSVRRNLTINLYGRVPNEAPVQSWSLRRAFPIKWTGPDLKADAGAIAMETIEFAHEGLIFNNTVNRGDDKNAPDLSTWQISENPA